MATTTLFVWFQVLVAPLLSFSFLAAVFLLASLGFYRCLKIKCFFPSVWTLLACFSRKPQAIKEHLWTATLLECLIHYLTRFFYLVVSFCFVFESWVLSPRYQCIFGEAWMWTIFFTTWCFGRHSLNWFDIVSISILQLIFSFVFM